MLGRVRAARLAHVVGLYVYTSTLLHLGAIPGAGGLRRRVEREGRVGFNGYGLSSRLTSCA